MRKVFIIIVAVLLLPVVVFAKEITLKEFGYSEGAYEGYIGVTETVDGGYVAVGMNYDHAILVKYDKEDKIVWKVDNKDYVNLLDLDIDKDGNIYVAGSTYGNDTVNYMFRKAVVYKYDKDGKLLKTTVVGDDAERDRVYFRDLELNDDKVVAVGDRCYMMELTDGNAPQGDNCGAYIVEFDKELTLKKQHLFDYDYEDLYNGVTLTSDGGALAVGMTYSYNIPGVEMEDYSYVPIVVKYNKDLSVEWVTGYPIDSELNEENTCYNLSFGGFMDAIETCDGNYAVVGSIPKMTKVFAPLPKSKWESLGENLKTVMPDLEIEDEDDYIYYESNAAILVKYDKTGKKINEVIENYEYDDVYTDILETKSCDLIVTGNIGHEPVSRPMSLRSNESLGYNSDECIRSSYDAKLMIYDKDLKEVFKKDYKGSRDEYLYNISPVGPGEFAAVGIFDSYDLKEVELSEDYDSLVVRLKIHYSITKEKTENGSFDASNEHGKSDIVYHGDTATITTTPDKGYKVDKVTVKDSNGEEVHVTKTENNTYEYPIYDDTWVTVTFKNVEDVNPPKTGVKDLLFFLFVGIALVVIVYNVVDSFKVFKKL